MLPLFLGVAMHCLEYVHDSGRRLDKSTYWPYCQKEGIAEAEEGYFFAP
jgi:hypothetical protein